MKNNISPEEKLLRLIRGQKWAKDTGKPSPKKKVHFPSISLKKCFLIIFTASCAYLAFSLAYALFMPKDTGSLKIPEKDHPADSINPAQGVKSYEFYSETIKGRNIFNNPGPQGDTENAAVVMGDDLLKDINLVGIIAGDTPQAVVEDKKSQKTYYVVKNQFIGRFQVEDIQNGKIILRSNGQKYELFL
ncbi:MAG: type II secretion system protein N [Candidatus Omnitrophota bacterium]